VVTVVVILVLVFVAFFGRGLFSKPLYNTTVEVLCQNTGRTFHIHTNRAHLARTCRCGIETFIVDQGAGKGDVRITYVSSVDNTPRQLVKVDPSAKHTQVALAQMYADSGSFILVSQEDV